MTCVLSFTDQRSSLMLLNPLEEVGGRRTSWTPAYSSHSTQFLLFHSNAHKIQCTRGYCYRPPTTHMITAQNISTHHRGHRHHFPSRDGGVRLVRDQSIKRVLKFILLLLLLLVVQIHTGWVIRRPEVQQTVRQAGR